MWGQGFGDRDVGFGSTALGLLWGQGFEDRDKGTSTMGMWPPAVALAGCCPLSPAGAQRTQLFVDPPWIPGVLWDEVTLTCRGSGTAGATLWYKEGRLACPCSGDIPEHPSAGGPPCWNWGPGDIGCDRSPLSPDSLVLQVPARALLEGDTVTLRCRRRWDLRVNSVSFYRDGEELGTLHNGTELSLPPLQLQHSGRYRCEGRVRDNAQVPSLGSLPRPGASGDPKLSLCVPSSGRRGWRLPPVPAPARGCHRGLAPLPPPGWVTTGTRGWRGGPGVGDNGVTPAHPELRPRLRVLGTFWGHFRRI
uniref:Ig-like domain-containing protein n=1 Tax=Ficedula albicollis TaxID=59894 RepID=A0A803VU29_FICAL